MSGLNQFTNNASTTLASGVSIGATSLTVASGTGMLFPTLAGSQYFYCTLANLSATALEIVKVTARSGDVFTIVRGQDNTTDQAWSAGDKVELRLTAADLQNFPQLDSTNTFAQAQTFTANPVMSGLTASKGVFTDASKNLSSTGTLGADQGGTGKSSLTANNVLLGNGTSAVQEVAPGSSGNVLTSNGTTWQSTAPASGARSGATTTSLTSGSATLTLTSSSNQLQFVSANQDGCFIVMPNATTLTAGNNYFTIYNTGNYAIGIKDNGGTIREYIQAKKTLSANIKDISTSNGVWEFGNPIAITNNAMYSPFTTVTNGQNHFVIPVTSTQGILIYTVSSTTLKCRLLTFNLSTKAITYGSEITVGTVSGGNTFWNVSGATDGVDRGFIAWGTAATSSGGVATVGHYYVGFAIVSGTLYLSTTTTGNTSSNTYVKYEVLGSSYLGSNNAFISFGRYDSYNIASNPLTCLLSYRQFTVTVAGTTVTVTNATGNGNITNTSSASGPAQFGPKVSKTSNTTFVWDKFNASGVYQSGGYISCDAATNTVSQGARTAQTTQMVDVVTPLGPYYGWSAFVINSAGTRVINNGYLVAVTDVGTANVTVAVATDIVIKPFSSPQYNTLSNSIYGFYAFPISTNNYYYESASMFTASSTNVIFLANANNSNITVSGYQYWSIDPTSSTFNINTSDLQYFNYQNYLMSTTEYFTFYSLSGQGSSATYDILSLASPFKN